jgi:hypothetical protein
MDTLINSVVPSIGTYCLTTIQDKAIVQTFHTDKNELVRLGLAASQAGKNAYYAMASFNDATTRTQGNVAWLKAFWLDVDCKDKDPLKDYANKDDGIVAISQFCERHSFPRPTVVDSGNGWHVYWVLDEAVDKATWQPVADMLKALCLSDGLRIDPACTADAARILRIPNTKNYRFNPPSTVSVVMSGSELMFDGFKGLIEVAYASLGATQVIKLPGTPTKKEISAVTKALLGNSMSSFKKIMMRSQAGTGCQQLFEAVVDQDKIDEPMWRAVLSVAQVCSDNAMSIHLVSKNHPDYDHDATIAKAEQTKGPYTCKTFDGMRSGVCSACPHFGKITSPIQLGNEIIAALAPVTVSVAPIVVAPVINEAVALAPVERHESAELDPIDSVDIAKIDASLAAFYKSQSKVTIPVPPSPYIRGQNGGLYKSTRLEDGTTEDVLLYQNDFYAYARLYDPEEGQVLACRLHLPLDGVRVFNIPLKAVGSRDKLREIICGQGVAAEDKALAELSRYLIASTKELERMQNEEKARTQMGWQLDKSFIVGAREYSKAGIRNCPPSNSTTNYQNMFRMEGDMASWRRVADVYKQPGFEIHQFVFFMALSSPLMKSIEHPGMLTTLISDESGIGKTTLGMFCNSVWGHPREMLSMPHDTINATVNRMGVFNSVSLFLDEITNKSPEVVSDIVYMATMGRGKNRLGASSNVERVNNTTWNLNTFATANAALRDKLGSLKASAEGENMRLFEFDMRGTPVLPKLTADTIFPLMQTNFGVAGHLLASWLVENEDKVEAMITQVQRKMDAKFKFTSKERNWSTSVAGAYTMAYIAKELGIHDWDINHNIEVMMTQIDKMRNEVEQSITKFDALISDFLVENHSYILVVDALPDANGLFALPKNRNITKVVARYEPDTGKLYIVSKAMRDYCVARQFSFNSLLTLSGGFQVSKRLTVGTGVVAGSTRAIEFDTNDVGLDMDLWHDLDVVDDNIVA